MLLIPEPFPKIIFISFINDHVIVSFTFIVTFNVEEHLETSLFIRAAAL